MKIEVNLVDRILETISRSAELNNRTILRVRYSGFASGGAYSVTLSLSRSCSDVFVDRAHVRDHCRVVWKISDAKKSTDSLGLRSLPESRRLN